MKLTLVLGLFLMSASAFAAGHASVVARYATWHRGDDDNFANCLVNSDSTGLILFEGLVPNYKPVSFRIKPADMKALNHALSKPVSKDLKEIDGYMLAEYGKEGMMALRRSEEGVVRYYPVADKSDVGSLLHKICKIDSQDE